MFRASRGLGVLALALLAACSLALRIVSWNGRYYGAWTPSSSSVLLIDVRNGSVVVGGLSWSQSSFDVADVALREFLVDLAEDRVSTNPEAWRDCLFEFHSLTTWCAGPIAVMVAHSPVDRRVDRLVLYFNLWLFPTLFLLYCMVARPIAGMVLRVRRRCSQRCVRCGYSLVGNTSGVCPECADRAFR